MIERQQGQAAVRDFKLDWRKRNWDSQLDNPELRFARAESTSYRVNPGLLNYGVQIELIDFPSGSLIQDTGNFPQIIRAFSRTFGPQLFEELEQTDPFASGEPYWSNFFFQISPNTVPPLMRLNVQFTGNPLGCVGNPGNYQPGGIMTIADCADEDVIFHEIGHAVMDDGILMNRKPLYFKYFAGGAIPVGGVSPTIDAKVWLNNWFGKALDSRLDIDGIRYGFVSDYAQHDTSRSATKNKAEDFAETFMYYVYRPTTLFEKVYRQTSAGSDLLSKKVGLISHLYAGVMFRDWGVPYEWPGYSL